MLSVVIPVSNIPEMTNECIDQLEMNKRGEVEIIVIDNASEVPFERNNITVVRNETNKGFWPSMMQGIEIAKSPIILCMHNDVLIWEQAFDIRFQ